MSDWTREYFEHGYAQRWGLPAPSAHVRSEVADLWRLLELAPNARVLDIGCGHGRHALTLAERGAEVIGVDCAVALLDRARHLAADLHLYVWWIRGDMRRLALLSECVTAAVLMDSLGFFDTEDENEAVLREAARVLAPRGRLVLKVVNGGRVLDTFRQEDREERDGTVVTVSRTLTLGPPRMTERVRVRGSRGNGEYERRQRLYRKEEVLAALARAGFSVVGVFANSDGTRFESTSPTMWIVAERRGAV